MIAKANSYLTILILLTLSCPAAGQEVCGRPEAVISYGTWFSPGITLNATNWTIVIDPALPEFNASSMRLLFQVKPDAQDRDWNIVVRDVAFRVLASLGANDFADDRAALSQRRWTGRLPSQRVRVDLLAQASSDAIVYIVEGIAMPTQSGDQRLFSIRGTEPSWKPLYETTGVTTRRAGDAVGMIVTGFASVPGVPRASWCCSGTMISADLMLTNWHCGGNTSMPHSTYWNPDICANAIVDLGWDDGAISRQYNCVEVVVKDERLDYAIIRLKPVLGSGGVAGVPVRARFSATAPVTGNSIFLIHHAQCKPKLISSACWIASNRYHAWNISASPADPGDGTEPDFTHDCDTEPGASGAPVFDSGGRIVGLHHTGFARDDQCRPVDRLNKAVRIDEIITHLRTSNPRAIREVGLD